MVQRCAGLGVPGINFRFVGKQQLRHILISMRSRTVQWRPAIGIFGENHIAIVFEQSSDRR